MNLKIAKETNISGTVECKYKSMLKNAEKTISVVEYLIKNGVTVISLHEDVDFSKEDWIQNFITGDMKFYPDTYPKPNFDK